MNEIEWHGHETVEHLYPLWVRLIEDGNRAGLLKELSAAANSGETLHERVDGEDVYTGPYYDSDEMLILELSYGNDADKITELIAESDDHEVGKNLQ